MCKSAYYADFISPGSKEINTRQVRLVFRQRNYRQADYRQTDYKQTDYGQTDYRQTDYRQTDYRESILTVRQMVQLEGSQWVQHRQRKEFYCSKP